MKLDEVISEMAVKQLPRRFKSKVLNEVITVWIWRVRIAGLNCRLGNVVLLLQVMAVWADC